MGRAILPDLNASGATKNPPEAELQRVFRGEGEAGLFQLHFLVIDMLASFGIKFLDQHFLRHGFLVFARGVEMPSSGCGFQLDFFASAFGCHDASLIWVLGLAARTQVCEHGVNAVFVDHAKTCIADAQANPAVLGFNPETAVLQIGQKPALGFVVGVGNIVSHHGAFARDLTYACHMDTPILKNSRCPIFANLCSSWQIFALYCALSHHIALFRTTGPQPHLASCSGGGNPVFRTQAHP
jgi:hypothetical protein